MGGGGGGEEDTGRVGVREGWMKREKRHGDEEREEMREMKRKRQREKRGRGGKRERKSVRQKNRQLDIDSQIVVHVIALKQILHTQTHFLYEM